MKEKVGNLIEQMAKNIDNPEDLKYMVGFVEESLGKFTSYFNAVVADVLGAESAMRLRDAGRIDQETFEFRRKTTDTARRLSHDVAIDACS